jgi:broad specificity phosphatase PhoE
LTYLILARHGNTFDAGQPVVWVGARTDMPLVAKGRDQAARIGQALRDIGLHPCRTITGPLRRTVETAEIALASLGSAGASIEIDERLREIDYGLWEGRSSDEIQKNGGAEELGVWENDGVWPKSAAWPLSREAYLERIGSALESVLHERRFPALMISSNGIFKLLADLLDGAPQVGKMGTGHMALLRFEEEAGRVRMIDWNVPPDRFPALAAQYSIQRAAS